MAQGAGDAFKSKLLALQKGLLHVWELGFRPVNCFVDCSEVQKVVITNSDVQNYWHGAVILLIREVIARNLSVSVTPVPKEQKMVVDALAKLAVREGWDWKGQNKTECLLPPTTQSYPWLLYVHNNLAIIRSILDPTETYSRSIPELSGANLLTVQHGGWCVLEKGGKEKVRELLLWNPFLQEKIHLPSLKHENRIRNCILSCSPTETDQVCSIFLFPHEAYGYGPNILFYCEVGDKQWFAVDYRKDLVRASPPEEDGVVYNPFLYSPVYFNGRLYAVSYSRLLVIIEKLEPPNGLQIHSADVYLPDPFPHTFPCLRQLLVCNHELFHIQISMEYNKIFGIAVHKLNFSHMIWERVKSIKDMVFFLSDKDLPFARRVNPGGGGLIYFTSMNNKFVHIFNLEDNSLRICKAFPSFPENWFPAKSFWVMPDLRRTLAPTTEGIKTQVGAGIIRMTIAPKEKVGKTQIRPNLRMTHALKEERGKNQTRGGESSATVHSDETRDRATNFDALPFHIVEMVANYLDAYDYLHFRATNCYYRHLRAPPLQWRSPSHISASSFDDLSLFPLFVYFEKEEVLTFVHPNHGIKYKYSINMPEDIQGGCEICYSKDGWLLLSVNTFSNIFFNPFTKEVKQLAYGPASKQYGPTPKQVWKNTPLMGFSHPPTSSKCVVVELQDFYQPTVHTTWLGKGKWKESIFRGRHFHSTNISPCFHNEAFYYLSRNGKLGILKLAGKKKIFWREYKKLNAPCRGYYKCFLVESNDSLLFVFENPFENWVRVFKLNESEKTWTGVKSLGNHMIFVGNQSFSAVASIPGMENKIYFPRFYNKNIVFYSLESSNYHTFESSEVVDFHCMEEKLNSSWIQPRW
ncbi:uncharacterized protein LOC130725421 [Lotus japonicus]|uniref:uncharacterized protein LOC130725421 n=1 Tax=Lotus japonicus TaxID=34305 RepID=UPI002587CD50|nr:uncharacterized protein LOC130725421 [Lotus japonicus]